MKMGNRNKGKINIYNLLPGFKFPHRFASTLVSQVLKYFNFKIENINIIFMNNCSIRRINKLFLKHDFPTDVISFRLNTENEIEGEIYLGIEMAKANSRFYKTGFYEEIKRIIIHGALHLTGLDDKTPKGKEIMRRYEDYFIEKSKKNK